MLRLVLLMRCSCLYVGWWCGGAVVRLAAVGAFGALVPWCTGALVLLLLLLRLCLVCCSFSRVWLCKLSAARSRLLTLGCCLSGPQSSPALTLQPAQATRRVASSSIQAGSSGNSMPRGTRRGSRSSTAAKRASSIAGAAANRRAPSPAAILQCTYST